MNKLIRIYGIMALGFVLMTGAPLSSLKAQPGISVSVDMFYNELSPYGQWIPNSAYGNVWRPNVSGDFRPYYTNGYWTMTEYGNTWVSGYDWGWGPFHYGRWAYDPAYGWIWIPDTQWGPAWVSWRTGGGYYGWAPMGPNISINIAIGSYNAPFDWWVFIPQRYVMNRNFHRYYRGPQYNTTIIHNTTIINNTYVTHNHRYISGPPRTEIERSAGHRVPVRTIRQETGPRRSIVKGNDLNIYRPDNRQSTVRNNTRPAPQQAQPAQRTQPAAVNDIRQNAVSNNVRQNTATPAQPARNTVNSPTPQVQQPRQTQMRRQPARQQSTAVSPQPRPATVQPQPVRAPQATAQRVQNNNSIQSNRNARPAQPARPAPAQQFRANAPAPKAAAAPRPQAPAQRAATPHATVPARNATGGNTGRR